MKKILTTAILCAGLVGFTACDSFLDEDPKSSLTLDTYYKTSADITLWIPFRKTSLRIKSFSSAEYLDFLPIEKALQV